MLINLILTNALMAKLYIYCIYHKKENSFNP